MPILSINGLMILQFGMEFRNNELRLVTKYKNNSRNSSKDEHCRPQQY
jgi:hypothetical protein